MNNRPTILVMTTIPDTLAAFFLPQLRHLQAAGFRVHVASSPGRALDKLPLVPGVSRHGVAMERQPHPRRDLVSLWRLVRLMRRIRPDVVHAHTPKAGLLGMAAALLAGVPTRLYTVHGLPLLTRTGWRRRMLVAAERASAALATQTYSVSESVRALLAELGICRDARVLGHGSCGGVDIERFRPLPEKRAAGRERCGLPSGAIVVTFVGRLAEDKGIRVLAQAWPGIAAQAPDAHLLLAGEPDRSDPVRGPELDALYAHPRVHAIGAVPQEQIPEIYAATDLAVLPTYREGLSQMALEAAACGVPLVSTRVSGLDPVLDGETGLLVPPGDPVALGEALLALIGDPAERARLSAAARAHVAEYFASGFVNQLWMREYLRWANRLAGRHHPAALPGEERHDPV